MTDREPLYAHEWKPRTVDGRLATDPRDELVHWANAGHGQAWVAVPVATLRAAAELRVCRASTVLRSDEDGPLSEPVTIHCNKREGHFYDHHNGYAGWD